MAYGPENLEGVNRRIWFDETALDPQLPALSTRQEVLINRPTPPPDTDRSHLIRAALTYLFEHRQLPGWDGEPWNGTVALELYYDEKYHDLWIRNTLFNSWLAGIDLKNHRVNLRPETVYQAEVAEYCARHHFKLVQPPSFRGPSDSIHGLSVAIPYLPEDPPMA